MTTMVARVTMVNAPIQDTSVDPINMSTARAYIRDHVLLYAVYNKMLCRLLASSSFRQLLQNLQCIFNHRRFLLYPYLQDFRSSLNSIHSASHRSRLIDGGHEEDVHEEDQAYRHACSKCVYNMDQRIESYLNRLNFKRSNETHSTHVLNLV